MPEGVCSRSHAATAQPGLCLRGANGQHLEYYGRAVMRIKVGVETVEIDFHVVDVMRVIVSVALLSDEGYQMLVDR